MIDFVLRAGLILAAFSSVRAAGAAPQACRELIEGRGSAARVAPSNPLKVEQMNYKLSGPVGAPVVVLVHGLGGSLATWTAVQKDLQRDYRVLSFDQRGHGRTANIGEDYSTSTLAQDLKSLLDHLGIDKVHLIGHSLGSRTSQKFMQLYPSRVLSFISEDMDAQIKQDSAPDKVEKSLKMGRYAMGLKAKYGSPGDLIRALLPLYDGDVDRAIRFARRIVSHIDEDTKTVYVDRPEVGIFYGFQGNTDDFGSLLRESKTPMLFLRANPDRSPFFDDSGVQHIRKNSAANPEAKIAIEEISAAEHTMHAPQTFAPYMQLVRDFLAHNRVSNENQGRFFNPALRNGVEE